NIELPVLAGVARARVRDDDNGVAAAAVDRRRILVVDDEEAIQQLLMGVLEMDGHDVSIASNGREALDKVGAEAFDLIITDIKMPVMGGPDLYKRLRDDGNPLAQRVIFITGDTVAPDTRKFLQGIKNTVLSKPFRLRDVRESVASALARAR
ncbi:MAG: response regulator, partial [Chloroflexi bacterium]|nr:response regulator [Chloroflexota bacterium]